MALILNTDPIVIVTSTDVSGYTLTTGHTMASYTDEMGNEHTNPYKVVDNFIMDKSRFFMKIYVNTYKNVLSRKDNLHPVDSVTIGISGDKEQWDTYFTNEILDTQGIYTSIYNFISDSYSNQFWVSDE